ncbi:MAG: hypothetical protein A3K61_05070 [Thaumarchaeota archaeon RBG_16_49_8]|nr:MAG: hypothetical protein A3K61_05070 [Thaumarchaeota archaeon RBG_16_49_8]
MIQMSKRQKIAAIKKDQAAVADRVRVTRTASKPPLMLLDPRIIEQAMNRVTETLNDPAYQEQLTKLTQASISDSLQTLQKFRQFSTHASKLDREGMNSLVNNSIGDLMRTYLQFNTDLIMLTQKLSSRSLDILEKAIQEEQQ